MKVSYPSSMQIIMFHPFLNIRIAVTVLQPQCWISHCVKCVVPRVSKCANGTAVVK
jgi:hypothetical protein